MPLEYDSVESMAALDLSASKTESHVRGTTVRWLTKVAWFSIFYNLYKYNTEFYSFRHTVFRSFWLLNADIIFHLTFIIYSHTTENMLTSSCVSFAFTRARSRVLAMVTGFVCGSLSEARLNSTSRTIRTGISNGNRSVVSLLITKVGFLA